MVLVTRYSRCVFQLFRATFRTTTEPHYLLNFLSILLQFDLHLSAGRLEQQAASCCRSCLLTQKKCKSSIHVRVWHRRHMPKGVDSCFGNFPMQYKTKDAWDGNPTLRRDSRTSYTSPQRSPTKTRRPKGSVSGRLLASERDGSRRASKLSLQPRRRKDLPRGKYNRRCCV